MNEATRIELALQLSPHTVEHYDANAGQLTVMIAFVSRAAPAMELWCNGTRYFRRGWYRAPEQGYLWSVYYYAVGQAPAYTRDRLGNLPAYHVHRPSPGLLLHTDKWRRT